VPERASGGTVSAAGASRMGNTCEKFSWRFAPRVTQRRRFNARSLRRAGLQISARFHLDTVSLNRRRVARSGIRDLDDANHATAARAGAPAARTPFDSCGTPLKRRA